MSDLQKIALKLTKGQQCDTLLQISEAQLMNRDSAIILKDKAIKSFMLESGLKEQIITDKGLQIDLLKKDLKKTQRKLKWTKFGWGTTTLLLSVAVGYFAFQ